MTYNIPQRTKESLDRYANQGIPTGGFLRAVLENDLMEAIGVVDDDNRPAIFDICAYVYNEIPWNCHGSVQAVKDWIEKHRKAREETLIRQETTPCNSR